MTFKIILLFTILCFFPFLFRAQEISSDWETILASDLVQNKKEQKLDSIINIYQDQNNDSLLERITHKYAVWKYKIGKLGEAITINQYSFELKKKIYPKDSALLQHGLKNRAFFYFKNNAYTKSIQSYEELLRINSKNTYAADAYASLGRCYAKIGDYYKAAFHFDLARSLLQEKNAYKNLITNNINAAGVDIKIATLSSYNRGIKNLLFTDSLAQKMNSKASTRYNINILLGTLYNQEKNLKFKKALDYYQEALEIAKKLNDSARIGRTLEIIGNLYNTFDPDLAIHYHKKSIDYNDKKDTLQLAISISNIGYCLEQKELYDQCIANYNKAIELLLSGTSISGLSASSQNASYLLVILKDLANVYLKQFKSTANKTSLQQSIKTFLMADQLIDLIRIESKEFQSRLYWRKQSAEVYGRAIEACFLAQNAEQAFYFMEKNKALLLTEDLINHKLRQSLKIPKEIIDRETALRKKIYLLEKERVASTEVNQNNELSIKILDQKRRLQKLEDSIHSVFDYYKNLDINPLIPNISSVQQLLDKNTVLLEYHISENKTYHFAKSKEKKDNPIEKTSYNAYMLCITKDDLQFIQLPLASQLKKDVLQLIESVSKSFKTENDITSYAKIGYSVFDQLFPEEKIKKIIEDKKVIIIPDNYLNYMPFEALVTSPYSDKKIKYLIENCEISYNYSHTFSKNNI